MSTDDGVPPNELTEAESQQIADEAIARGKASKVADGLKDSKPKRDDVREGRR